MANILHGFLRALGAQQAYRYGRPVGYGRRTAAYGRPVGAGRARRGGMLRQVLLGSAAAYVGRRLLSRRRWA